MLSRFRLLVLILLVPLLLFGYVFYLTQTIDVGAISRPTISFEKPEQIAQPNYLSIDYLRNRDFEGSTISIGKKVSGNGAFDGYIGYYYSDGIKINTLVNIPKKDGKLPVVIVNHGYIPPDQYSTTQSYKTISDFYANNGYLVLKPDYRCHGESECSTDTTAERRFAYTLDVLNLIESLDSLENADLNNIFMYGHSMGGDIALRTTEVTNKIKAVTMWAPAIHDYPYSHLFFMVRSRSAEEVEMFKKYVDDLAEDGRFDKYSSNSKQNLEHASAPILIHHGRNDESVPFSWAQYLAEVLDEADKEYSFNIYDFEDHNFRNGSWGVVANRDLDWFSKWASKTDK